MGNSASWLAVCTEGQVRDTLGIVTSRYSTAEAGLLFPT